MTGFSPKSARTVEADHFGKLAVADNATLQNVPSVAKTALSKFSTTEIVEVRQLKDQLMKLDVAALGNYGANVQDKISAMADDMLKHTKSSDMDFIGSKLTSIILVAKGINTSSLADKSRVPLIGGWIDKIRNVKEQVSGQFDLATTQVEKVIVEVDTYSRGITTRLQIMEQLYAANLEQYHTVDKLVIAARMAIEDLQSQTDAFVAQLGLNSDPYDVQQVNDARNYITSLDMKASNLERIKISAVQAAPAIRLLQQNGIQLIEQFKLIKSEVVPNWKRNFMVALTVDEQKRGVELNTKIVDFSNELARNTATQLKQTSIDVARANQRGIIDLSTIEHVQSELISGIEAVLKITEDGTKQRELVSKRVVEMQNELQTKLTQRK